MRRRYSISFVLGCQIFASHAAAAEPAPRPYDLPKAPSTVNPRGDEWIERLKRLHLGGSMSLNWRNVGPRKPGFETQIQNEVYLADTYFGFDGALIDDIPIQAEWQMPTANRGAVRLNQVNFAYKRVDNLLLQFGKFLVPFGRYNELYRPDQFLTVTRPLLYASPDSLDLVVRLNSPRPPLSSGYTDIGARVTYYPAMDYLIVPEEATFFVVNGLGESTNRVRTFPNTDNLGIEPVPGAGTTIDFGHQDNNLADNNNSKSVGGRLIWALGDVRFPWPFPEGASDLKGMSLGLSGMGGQFDLEGRLNYQMYGLDVSFDYLGFNVSSEYLWSNTQFLAPQTDDVLDGSSATNPVHQIREWEVNHGYFVQASFPILRTPPIGQRLTGALVFNQMFRRGPVLNLLLDQPINGTTFPSVTAMDRFGTRATTRIDKYTAALNYRLTDHFTLKFDYSYWTMGQASTRSVTSLGLVDIYQSAFSMVLAF